MVQAVQAVQVVQADPEVQAVPVDSEADAEDSVEDAEDSAVVDVGADVAELREGRAVPNQHHRDIQGFGFQGLKPHLLDRNLNL